MSTVQRSALLFAFAGLLAFPSALPAHRLDEYLQATLVAIEPDSIRLQINLTPGVAVVEQVLAQIDGDRDGVVSVREAAAYAEVLKRDLDVRLDEHNLGLKLTRCSFPEPAELRTGSGIIQLEFSLTAKSLSAGGHNLSIENRHLAGLSVYLINAAKPKAGTIEIIRQKRNATQSSGEIEFTFSPSPPAS